MIQHIVRQVAGDGASSWPRNSLGGSCRFRCRFPVGGVIREVMTEVITQEQRLLLCRAYITGITYFLSVFAI